MKTSDSTSVGILGIGIHLPPEVRKNDWWPASVVDRWPDSARIFARYTLGCASCAISKSETIAQAAAGHGAGRVKLEDLIGELNVFADTGHHAQPYAALPDSSQRVHAGLPVVEVTDNAHGGGAVQCERETHAAGVPGSFDHRRTSPSVGSSVRTGAEHL